MKSTHCFYFKLIIIYCAITAQFETFTVRRDKEMKIIRSTTCELCNWVKIVQIGHLLLCKGLYWKIYSESAQNHKSYFFKKKKIHCIYLFFYDQCQRSLFGCQLKLYLECYFFLHGGHVETNCRLEYRETFRFLGTLYPFHLHQWLSSRREVHSGI